MGKGKAVSDVDFVTEYAKAKSLDEVATQLGMTKESVQARAFKLRKAGVGLPRFTKSSKPVDVSGLNAILEKAGRLDLGKTQGKKKGAK
jgi:hypothetical protein